MVPVRTGLFWVFASLVCLGLGCWRNSSLWLTLGWVLAVALGLWVGRRKAAAEADRFRRELAEQKLQWEAVLEGMEDGVLTLGPGFKVVTFNRAAEEITGWSRDRVIGRCCGDLFEGGERLEKMARGEVDPVPHEQLLKVRDGVKKALSFAPSRNPRGEELSLVVVFRDVSKVKELEHLRHDFTTTLSHELRTPLTSIKGYLNTLMHRRAEDFSTQKVKSTLAIINHQVDRLSRLIADLLDAARLESQALRVHPRPTRLGPLLRQVVVAFQEREPRFDIVFQVDERLEALADPEQLSTVLEHLLSNALKYSIPGGPIEVKAQSEGSRVRISVRDEGVGIPFDQQARIFEMYHRVETGDTRTHYGVGMGLYIVKKVIEAHRGEITVESAPGCGATFSFTLPQRADR